MIFSMLSVHVWLYHKGAFGCEGPIVLRLLLFGLYVKSGQAMIVKLHEKDGKRLRKRLSE
jgi:hypothetical protein